MGGAKRDPRIAEVKASIKEFILEDIRCFEGRNVFKIKPLTFLVGENSTGKSTVLGCFQALMDFHKFANFTKLSINFNRPPYTMGIFSDIARRSKKAAKKFKLGFTLENKQDSAAFNMTFVEKKGGFGPVPQKIEWEFDDGKIIFAPSNGDEKTHGNFDVKYKDNNGKKEFLIQSWEPFSFFDASFLEMGEIIGMQKKLTINKRIYFKFLQKHASLLDYLSFSPPGKIDVISAKSFAPIRTKPKRTYDPLEETGDDPEGGDMPMVVMKMSKFNQSQWKNIEEKLKKFGKSAGLFSDISVKSSEEMGGSFQLRIDVQDVSSNMMDVGYGVSQILPILVRIFKAKKKKTFLLQQPEVHLHPRAQAELSSLLAQMTQQKNGYNFLIETHSDYMIDRARIEIHEKKIRPEDVALIYLEYKDNKTKVHNISFDKNANMIGVPKSYRQFFLRETHRLLGFD